MDENLQIVYNEIRKIIIKDNLKLMKDTSPEYITLAGEAFLDGLQVNGECIEIVSKEKYEELIEENSQLKKKWQEKELNYVAEISKLETRHEEVLKKYYNSQIPKKKKKFLNFL